jgi:hypothetical protein
MKRFSLLIAIASIASIACEDTPPAGQTTLQAPHSPVFFRSGAVERLAFIDSGHSMIRFLDLDAGTYQYGGHPFFPRGVLLNDEPIALTAIGETLFALDAAGQIYTVSAALEGALPQPAPPTTAEVVGLVQLGEIAGRIESDCGLAPVGAADRLITGESTCSLAHGAFVAGELGGSPQLWPVDEAGLGAPIALPWPASAMTGDGDGGVWLLSLTGLAVLHIDAAGTVVTRFGLERPAASLAITQDSTGQLLALAGLDGAIAYTRADGGTLGDRLARTPLHLARLAGSIDVLGAKPAIDGSLAVGDYILRATPERASGSAIVGFSEDAILVSDLNLDGAAEVGDWVRLATDESSCDGRVSGLTETELTLDGVDGICPSGAVSIIAYAPVWAVYDGQKVLDETALQAPAGLIAPDAPLSLGGVEFSTEEVPTINLGTAHLRVGAGLRTTLDSDGWLSGITAAVTTTFYGSEPSPWLWVTVPTQAALYQLPVAAQQTFDMVIFR